MNNCFQFFPFFIITLLILSISTSELQQQTREPVECYVTEMFGIAPPNKPHREPKLACTSINTSNNTDIYSISGNGVEEFFDGVDISDGNVKLFVPPDLITGFNIRINEHTMDEIDLELDEVMRRRLNIVNNKGNRQLLVIRVSNDNSNMRVNQDAAQLRNDFFWDENNVVSIVNVEMFQYFLCFTLLNQDVFI